METPEKITSIGCVEVCRLYICAGHNFFGPHGKPPGQHPMLGMDEIECVAGRGGLRAEILSDGILRRMNG